MNPEIKAQWVAALRSGEYEQGTGFLNVDGKFCCLGVLCEQAVKAGIITKTSIDGRPSRYAGDDLSLPRKVQEWSGLADDAMIGLRNNPKVVDRVQGPVSLAELNDGSNGYESRSFAQLADLIEAQF